MRQTIKGLNEIIKRLAGENAKLKTENNAWKALALLMIAFFGIYAIVSVVYWLRDVAIPKAVKDFSDWYGESEFNRGFWNGTAQAFLIIFVLWTVFKLFDRGWIFRMMS